MITAIQPYIQNSNPVFGAKLPGRKVVVDCFEGKQVIIDKFIKKPNEKETVFQNLKHMFFETFPKLDPEYKKVFGHLDKKV